MPRISTKRVYDVLSPKDGLRVLVDRVWPRGLTKEKAAVDHWAKDIAPSTELRKWFAHDPARWEVFQESYKAELKEKTASLRAILDMCAGRPITLLFSARDMFHNQATVLQDVLTGMAESKSGGKRT